MTLKRILVALAVAGALALGMITQAAIAAGPPENVNYTANVAFELKADQPNLTCYLHNTSTGVHFCASAGQFGYVRTDVFANRVWFVPRHGYALPTGSLFYQAKGHPDMPVTWFGGRQPLVRYFNGVRYHLTGGWELVLRAAR